MFIINFQTSVILSCLNLGSNKSVKTFFLMNLRHILNDNTVRSLVIDKPVHYMCIRFIRVKTQLPQRHNKHEHNLPDLR